MTYVPFIGLGDFEPSAVAEVMVEDAEAMVVAMVEDATAMVDNSIVGVFYWSLQLWGWLIVSGFWLKIIIEIFNVFEFCHIDLGPRQRTMSVNHYFDGEDYRGCPL